MVYRMERFNFFLWSIFAILLLSLLLWHGVVEPNAGLPVLAMTIAFSLAGLD